MKKTIVKCNYCNKTFFRRPSQSRWNNIFCDKNCRAKFEKGKIKIERARCIICDKKIYIPPARYKRSRSGRCYCSRKCYQEYKRKNNDYHNWQGGSTGIDRGKNWNIIRKRIYKRDNWECQICKKHCHDDIQCHHIVPYRATQDNSESNLITLCRSCHGKEENKYYRNKNE